MRALLCPRCGEWMDEAHPDFPRCVFCGEHLLRCGVCRHFPGDGRPCPRAKGRPIVYANTVLPCPHHTPMRAVRRTGAWLSPHAQWQLAASLMLTVSVVLVAVLSRPTPPRLLLTAAAPRQVLLGDTWEMRLLVQSDGRSPLRLRLDRRLLRAFQLVGLTPLPLRVDRYGDWYEFLLPAQAELQPVVVRFKSVRLGDYFMRAVVLNTRMQAEWHGRVRVVKTAPRRQPPQPLGVLALALPR